MNQKGSADITRSAGVAPEVNLKNLLHAGNNHSSEGSNLALKPTPEWGKFGPLAVTDTVSASLVVNLLVGYIGSSKEE